MADDVNSQRFFRDGFVDTDSATPMGESETLISVVALATVPAPADTPLLTLFVRDSDAPLDTVLLDRE